ncbi:hypothetical protein WDZ16_15260 [Pseudokineococcus marinus]|uniref:Uncharacterized protein n=1 Tax=Pseudokineococcus marinus TaxID=351215 RepID=A0A849BLY4_9ACTN|nr:hypothetical protein [Pseudokineococcus marinus]NNH23661.1 hypothetical protein [Pseudokineococcus marinus]
MASLAMALAAAASLPLAHRVDPLAPLVALALIPVGGLTALVLGVRAGSTLLIVAGGAVAFLLIPCAYYAAVLIGGP